MLNIFINSNIDKDVYSWNNNPFEIDSKGKISLKKFNTYYSFQNFNGKENLYSGDVYDDERPGAFVDMFFYEKTLEIAPKQHVNINFSFFTKDELDYFNEYNKYMGFKLLVIKSNTNNILNLNDYEDFVLNPTTDYFILPKDPIYQDKGVIVQMGNFFDNGIEKHLTQERSIDTFDYSFKRNYQDNYINNSNDIEYLTFLITSRRGTLISIDNKTVTSSELHFQLDVYTNQKQNIELVPFYYRENKSYVPYLNFQKINKIMYGINNLSIQFDNSDSISGINQDDIIYGNSDNLATISLSQKLFTVEFPLSKSDFINNSAILYYRINNMSYISYIDSGVVVTKIASPFSFYKEDDSIVFFDDKFIKRHYNKGDYIKVYDVKGLTKSSQIDIFNADSNVYAQNKYNYSPYLALTCFVDLSTERKFVIFPFNDFKSISLLKLDFSFGSVPKDALSRGLIPIEVNDDFELKRQNGFFNVKLNIYNNGELLKEINMVHSPNLASQNSLFPSIYSVEYLVEDEDNDFLSDWNSELNCEVVLSNKKNAFFGNELKPIMFLKIMVNGIK